RNHLGGGPAHGRDRSQGRQDHQVRNQELLWRNQDSRSRQSQRRAGGRGDRRNEALMNRRAGGGREPSRAGTGTTFPPEPVSRTTLPPLDLPSAWLERLLDTVGELAQERDAALAVHRLLETAVELLPEMSFAVRLSEGRTNEEEPLI